MLTEIELNIYRKYIYLMNATLGEFPFVFSIFLRSNSALIVIIYSTVSKAK